METQKRIMQFFPKKLSVDEIQRRILKFVVFYPDMKGVKKLLNHGEKLCIADLVNAIQLLVAKKKLKRMKDKFGDYYMRVSK